MLSKARRVTVALVLGGLASTIVLRGQETTQEPAVSSMQAQRLLTPPRLDGRVEEDEWAGSEPAQGFVQQLPQEGAPASEETEVRIGFTRDTLYVGVICFDSQEQGVVSTQARRDGVLRQTDAFEMLFDTYDDDQNGYIFATTPAGIEYDAQIVHGGQSRRTGGPARAGGAGASGFGGAQRGGASSFNLNWDGVWQVAARTTKRGWEAEFAIPFRTLRYSIGENQTWGVNFKRNIRRKNEQVFWAPVSRGFNFHRVSLAGELNGLEVPFHRNLQITPYVVGGVSQDFSEGPTLTDGIYDAGLDLKYTLTSSLTLDFTVNTDFSQVEVDEEQVNLTRFDLFFPEKRPFFLENAGHFQVGTPREVELFFSRRIGIDPSGTQIPILGGVRFSGKVRDYNIGFLNMQTEGVSRVAPAANFTVGRVAREFGQRSSVGAIAIYKGATGGGLEEVWNRTFGVDANVGVGEHLTFFNYLAKTDTPHLTGRDHAGSTEFRYLSDLWGGRVGYTEVGEDFNPEMGFVRRVGYRNPTYRIEASPRFEDGRLIRRFWPHHSWETFYRFDGEPESGFRHNDFHVFFQNGSSAGLAFNQNFEQLFEPFEISEEIFLLAGSYFFDDWTVTAESDQSASFYASGQYSFGNFYSGTIRTANLRVGIRAGANFLLNTRYIRNDVRLPVGDFVANLAVVQVNYSFTPKSYIQSLIQYNNAIDELGANIRFALLRTASTGIFVVYNTHFDTLGMDVHDQPEDFARIGLRRRTVDRALIAKFTYLFDF